MSFVATGRSLIQSGFPSFHAGVAYITSEIQWYSPLTGWSDRARLSAPVDIFLLGIIPIKCQTHSALHDRVHCDLMSWPKESNDRKLWGYKKKKQKHMNSNGTLEIPRCKNTGLKVRASWKVTHLWQLETAKQFGQNSYAHILKIYVMTVFDKMVPNKAR